MQFASPAYPSATLIIGPEQSSSRRALRKPMAPARNADTHSLICLRCALPESFGKPAFQHNRCAESWSFCGGKASPIRSRSECRLIITGTDVQVATSPEKIMSARSARAGPDLLCLRLRHRASRRRNEAGNRAQRTKASCSRVDGPTCTGAKRTARYLKTSDCFYSRALD